MSAATADEEATGPPWEQLQGFLKKHPKIATFLLNPAGLTFLFGSFIFMGMVVGWMAILVIDAEVGRDILLMTITEFTLGREVAIPFGVVELGLPPLIVFGIAFSTDLITTTWFYPLFYQFRRSQRTRNTFWGFFFRRIEAAAEKNRAFVERYGPPGLFVFMHIPFAINGPLIGSIIGKLVGMRTRWILPTVLLATTTATAAWTISWTFFGAQAKAFTDRFGGNWIPIILVFLVLSVIAKVVFSFLKEMREFKVVEKHRRELADRLNANRVDQTIVPEPKRPHNK